MEPIWEPKPIWESKTFWVNLLAGIALAIEAALGQGGLIPDAYMQYVVFALVIVNIILRFVTTQPVELRARE